MNIIDTLNEKQKEAVLATEGPVLILAGAGSGKTRALTHRIAYLIYEKSVPPQNILAVTFTNKAAGEMRNRVAELLGVNAQQSSAADNKPQTTDHKLPTVLLPWLGTFHAVCVKILRREAKNIGLSSEFVIYDEDDSIRAIKRAMRELEVPEKKYNPRAIKSFISGAKAELITASDYQNFAHDNFQKIVADVFIRYEKILNSANAFDFDDLILKTVQLLQKNQEILKKYQDRFKYILVDEYQDTNHAQYVFLKLLAAARRNIFVIGDDWQSIYSFRGAKFQNILDFEKDYPDAKVIRLEQNYRSRQPIVEAAQEVIKHNQLRSEKNLFTEKDGGAPVAVIASPRKSDEVEFILDEIESIRIGERRNLSDFVILYRTNAQSRLFEEALISRGIPYQIIGGLRFYERREIKDILAYLSFIQNPDDIVSLSRIINVPPRGIGEKTLEKIIQLGEKAQDEIPKYGEFSKKIDELRQFNAESPSLDELIEKIMKITGYREYLADGTVESEGRLENIEELKNAASSYGDLSAFLESVSLVSDVDEMKDKKSVLTLMTIHCAKGLEFPVVFISGLEEGLFPHSRSLDDAYGLEEERRLFYVGMTRAMERLYISWAQTRSIYGRIEPCAPSRFLDELPKEKIEQIEL